jgi:hypothetical protein
MNQENVICTCNGILFALKKKEMLPFMTTWMEDINLGEISQT